jgi:hypothetical protein
MDKETETALKILSWCVRLSHRKLLVLKDKGTGLLAVS